MLVLVLIVESILLRRHRRRLGCFRLRLFFQGRLAPDTLPRDLLDGFSIRGRGHRDHRTVRVDTRGMGMVVVVMVVMVMVEMVRGVEMMAASLAQGR